ncbi:gpi inositol-deacylase [Trichoderma arundinaceum]|uniref:GPI inositol-deacylase n=1 Tax=Trichoderma arundinaceum TaxID=490622 RepID=A0A395NMC1_TRIAR|nr:gpi inositol-deacylase [Trichoderma arundinaceum]
MKRRSSSVDVGGKSSLELQNPDAESEHRLNGLVSRQSSVVFRQSSGLYSNQANGHQHPSSHAAVASFSPLSLPTSSHSMTTTKQPPLTGSGARNRSLWFMSVLSFFVATAGVGLLVAIFRSLITRQIEPKGCRMSYMRPSYIHFSEFDTEHTRFASKYSLYLYREQGIDGGQLTHTKKLRGIPVLFIPGNAGSYKQVRPIAAEAANYFHDYLQHDRSQLDSGIRSLDFFTVDFNEDITAFHGQTLLDQAEYLNEAVRYILSLYSEPQRGSRDSHLPDPTSVLILGHSMGGVVARAMLVQPNYQENSINTIITMSAPHARPPVTFDGRIVQIYNEINDYWRRAYTQKWASNNPLWHVTLVSIAGGNLDTVVPSDYASIESLVPETHGFTVFTSGIPTVWTSMDHQAILWCDQFRRVLAQTLYGLIDVHRASQTKPRAQRMRVFKKRLLTGLETIAEKTLSLSEPTILLTLDDLSSTVVPTGGRLTLSQLGSESRPMAYLLPIPPHGSPELKRFTLLTDAQLIAPVDNNQLQVLLCSVSPFQSASVNSIFSSTIDLSRNGTTPTRLACKDAASDTVLLPASRADIETPFYLDGQPQIHPFSYLQYDAEYLSDHQFVAVIDRATKMSHGFAVAEFSDHSSFQKREDISLARLLTFGLSFRLPAHRPVAMNVNIPTLRSSLLAYDMVINNQQCEGKQQLFAPLIRQYIQRPYESKYFVNARTTGISFHGVAPYMPPPLTSSGGDGLAFGIWSDPTCEGPLEIDLYVDVLGSLGKLYMRYRTVFAAFPLLIVTFHKNDLLIGTDDPFFIYLVPFIGIVRSTSRCNSRAHQPFSMPNRTASWLRWILGMGERRKLGDVALDIVLFAGMMTAGLYVARTFLNPILSNLVDPDKEKHEQAKRQAKAHLDRLSRRRHIDGIGDNGGDGARGGSRVEELVLNEYENLIALEMVAPDDIHVGFDDIGGLDMIIEELKESVIYPLTMPHLYQHAASLLSAPSGVLLYGPPGCGKTMLAKALAKESGASFINLHISTLTEKWYGDSNKIVRAVFSLARKMQPAIVFIDEIDAVLGTRRSGEHEASGMVKAEFMTLWDGLTSSNSSGIPAQIVVLGATNRIHDIDEAILRRMPKKFPITLPSLEQRRRILQLILKDAKVDAEKFDLDHVSKITAGMSGSDIKEACRDAAMAPVREYMRQHGRDGSKRPVDPAHFRGIRTDDFLKHPGDQYLIDVLQQRQNGPNHAAANDTYGDIDETFIEPQD